MERDTMRLVILVLGLLAALGMVSCVVVTYLGAHDPSGICVISGTCVGALTMLVIPKSGPN